MSAIKNEEVCISMRCIWCDWASDLSRAWHRMAGHSMCIINNGQNVSYDMYACTFIENFPDTGVYPVQADFAEIDGAEKIAAQIFSLQAIVFANGHAYYELLEDTPVAGNGRSYGVSMCKIRCDLTAY